MGADGRRHGQLSAWLQKKKSGSSAVRVFQYNKRYFTLDFDSGTFFYTHEKSSKKVSSIIPFADIVGVRLPDSQVDRGDNVSEASKVSRVSWMKRLGSSSRFDVEEHSLIVMTNPSRTMELLCSSAAEVATWYEAFQAAIAAGELKASMAAAAAGVGEAPAAAAPESPLLPDSPSSGEAARCGRGLTGGAADRGRGAAPAKAPPAPRAKGTFLDFSTDPEAGPPGSAQVEPASAKIPPARAAAAGEDIVELSSPSKLQAKAFGFDGEDSAASSAASSPVGTPRGAAGRSAEAAPQGGAGAAGAAETPPKKEKKCYADRHEGLSMQERLANLEFSDAEDDDDDILGVGKAKVARP